MTREIGSYSDDCCILCISVICFCSGIHYYRHHYSVIELSAVWKPRDYDSVAVMIFGIIRDVYSIFSDTWYS